MAPQRRAVKKKSVRRARPLATKGVAKKRLPQKPVARMAKPRKPTVATKKPVASEANLEKIGEVSHYFPHVKAAAVKITRDRLRVGDEITIKGHTTDFKEKIVSLQLDHVMISEGKKGQEIGLLVKSRVRIGDTVYRIR